MRSSTLVASATAALRGCMFVVLTAVLGACHCASSSRSCCDAGRGIPSAFRGQDALPQPSGASLSAEQDASVQRQWYFANKAEIDAKYSGQWVVIAGNQVFAADDIGSAEQAAMRAFPGRQFFATVVPRPAHLPGQPVQR